MATGQKVRAILVVAVSVGAMLYTLISGNQPFLGLDLQGGVSVVLEPEGGTDAVTLEQTRDIIRQRVDGLGVAEPDVKVQGSNIVVALPGVEDKQRVLALVGETAVLRFRPVIANLGGGIVSEGDETPENVPEPMPGDDSDDGDGHGGDDDGDVSEEGLGPVERRDRRQTTTTLAGNDEVETTEPEVETTEPEVETTEPEVETTEPEVQVETEATDGDDGEVPSPEDIPGLSELEAALQSSCLDVEETTPAAEDDPNGYSLLSDPDGNRYCVGPSLLTGSALETAGYSNPSGVQWQVDPVFQPGPEGIDLFNAAAARCFGGSIECPTGQLAMVLDQTVLSAPAIQSANFTRDRIQITGSFDQDEAEEVALKLRYGALPVELTPQDTRTVSATIGDDVLRSGLTAGLVGLAMVAIFLLYFYRLAGLIALIGVGLSGMLLWSIIAWLGENQGLAITLAGVVGLIVSIGVSADSNIVYFENVKDLVRKGRRVPTAIDRAYETSISTIIKADVVSLIAAALLYWLTVGAVRGFATYLGIATMLDLVISTTFMRPALVWASGLDAVKKNPTLLGIRSVATDKGTE